MNSGTGFDSDMMAAGGSRRRQTHSDQLRPHTDVVMYTHFRNVAIEAVVECRCKVLKLQYSIK